MNKLNEMIIKLRDKIRVIKLMGIFVSINLVTKTRRLYEYS